MRNIRPITDPSKPKVYIETYGCQMNVHDSENIKAILEDIDSDLDKMSDDILKKDPYVDLDAELDKKAKTIAFHSEPDDYEDDVKHFKGTVTAVDLHEHLQSLLKAFVFRTAPLGRIPSSKEPL